jgi:hypothetical protein
MVLRPPSSSFDEGTDGEGRWAPFLLKKGVPDKERLLGLREENRRGGFRGIFQ